MNSHFPSGHMVISLVVEDIELGNSASDPVASESLLAINTSSLVVGNVLPTIATISLIVEDDASRLVLTVRWPKMLPHN